MGAVYTAINIVLSIFEFALIARVLLSWLPNINGKIVDLLYSITEPILGPIRSLLSRSSFFGNSMFDFSPIVAFLLISVIRNFLVRILFVLL